MAVKLFEVFGPGVFGEVVPEGLGVIVSEAVGEAISVVKMVGVKLGIGVNVPVGRSVGVNDDSIDVGVDVEDSIGVDIATVGVPCKGF